jgi:peroxiredoxin
MHSDYHISKRMAMLFAAAALVLATMNVVLVRQNRSLKASTGLDRNLELQPGRAVPGLEGKDLDGNPVRIDYTDSRKTLLLVFSPGCRFCGENMPNWRTIVSGVDPNAYRVVGVSLVPLGTREYLSGFPAVDYPIVAEIDPSVRVQYSLVLSPQTIVIDQSGVVERVWNGLLNEESVREIKTAVGSAPVM